MSQTDPDGPNARSAARIAALEELVAELAAELRSRDQQAERTAAAQRLEALGRLAGGVAHDLGNLMVAISGYTEMALVDLPGDHPAADDIREIRRATDRAYSLMRQLLTFSQRSQIQPRAMDVREAVRGLEPMLRVLLGDAVELRLEAEPGLCTAVADPQSIERVVVNLVVNARDAMPGGGVVTVRIGPSTGTEGRLPAVGLWGPSVRLSVADTGTGIDPSVLRQVFEPFFTTKGGSASGLGLATVYGIVNQAGGGIDVRSRPGEGAEFTVYLPTAHEPSRSPT